MKALVFFTPLAALALSAFGQEENLLKNASFELPAVKEKTDTRKSGSPVFATEGETIWTQFQVFSKAKENEGLAVVGLTNEIARTGKQSIFVDFQKLKTKQYRSFLMTDIFSVKPANTYRVAIWGRTDKKRPLTLDQRRPYMQVEAEFFGVDAEEQVGEVETRTQMIPGSLNRLLFTSNKWGQYVTNFKTPRNAAFMKVTFRWDTGREDGETDGAIYFDDASVTLVPGGESLVPVDPSELTPPTPTETDPEEKKEE
jgi:hypothetical protein